MRLLCIYGQSQTGKNTIIRIVEPDYVLYLIKMLTLKLGELVKNLECGYAKNIIFQ